MDWFLVKIFFLGFVVSLQIHGYYGCFEEERLALLDFKAFVHSNGDDADLLLPSWIHDRSSDCCRWERVTCNSTTGHVIKLSLNDTRQITFDGYYEDMSIWYLNVSQFQPFKELISLNLSYNAIAEFIDNEDSKSFSKLNKLEHIDLSWNLLDKQVLKVLGKFSALKSLDLHNNFIAGQLSEKDLAELCNLKVLILQFNELNGTLPIRYLGNFSSLEVLDLSINYFTGSILPNIGHLSSLRALSVSKNQLNGSLPTQGLCQLQKLEEMDLSQNFFQGTLPPCLSNLSSLRLLDLSANHFSGEIPSSLVSGMTSLEYIDLSHNLFEGLFSFSSFSNHSRLEVVQIVNDNDNFEVETEYSSWVPPFKLKVLRLPHCNLNKLSNTIPTFLFYQHELRILDLSHNNLTGRLDWLLDNNTRLEFLSLRNNSFVGQLHLPPLRSMNSQRIDVSDNKLYGKIQANIGQMIPYAIYLNLSKNSFEGSIPSSIGDLFYLEQLDLSFNNFSGKAPKALVANLVNLQTLKLSANRFRGQIFSAHFNLTWIEFLHLENNQLTGSLSNVILRSSQLTVLDISNNNISGNIPMWIGNMINLRTLAMRNNQLKGPLPCINLPFSFIDLSYNYLTGLIPTCLELQNTMGLYLQGNKFTGSIPESILNSSTLSILDIRDNNLSGKIPDSITSLPNLQVLLLKGNHLSGVIPIQLCQLNQIGFMDLSNNLFSGSIPRCFYNITFKEPSNYYSFIPAYFKRTIYEYGSILLDQYAVYDPNDGYTYENGAIDFLTKSESRSYEGDILDFKSGLDMSSNNFSGEIPHELGKLSQIFALNLSHNQLGGSIPRTLSNLSQVESLDLSYNNLSGEIPPELTDLHFLKFFNVSHNNLSGKVPAIKPQFGTFDNSSYEGNPFLCGLPLVKSCRAFVAPQNLQASSSDEAGRN
ncbi:receptor like protein 21-like isoform X2 [Hevea brasiliensis]|uniref:receptor like protein 21-like isoform X2 n=1 Tax=Hevea brasiliensis TaxID=3981 RepID=UPI0025E9B250|nr:receptor like protein 21-like isoform X2 [Hevea brasiliensis]